MTSFGPIIVRGEWDGMNTRYVYYHLDSVLFKRKLVVRCLVQGGNSEWRGARKATTPQIPWNLYFFLMTSDLYEKHLRLTVRGIRCSRQKGVSRSEIHL